MGGPRVGKWLEARLIDQWAELTVGTGLAWTYTDFLGLSRRHLQAVVDAAERR